MSNRLLTLLAIVATVAPATVRGQLASSETDSLLRRVRALDSAMTVRARSVDSIRRMFVTPIPPIDIREGPIHVRTDATLAPRVRSAVSSVVEMVDRRGGTLIASRASAHVAVIRQDSTRSIVGMLPVIAIDADTAARWSMIAQREVRAPASVAAIANGLAAIVEQRAMQGVDSALAAWIMVGRAPLRPVTDVEAANAYVEYATSESAVVRRCRARDIAACLDALGVDSSAGARLDRWYTAEDYRALVRTVAPARDDSAAVAAWIRCRRRGEDASCAIAARALPLTGGFHCPSRRPCDSDFCERCWMPGGPARSIASWRPRAASGIASRPQPANHSTAQCGNGSIGSRAHGLGVCRFLRRCSPHR